MKDALGKDIGRGPYIDRESGEYYRVYFCQDEQFHIAAPELSFNANVTGNPLSTLTQEIASRLIRLENPRKLEELLKETRYFIHPKWDGVPINPQTIDFERTRAEMEKADNQKRYEEIAHLADHLW